VIVKKKKQVQLLICVDKHYALFTHNRLHYTSTIVFTWTTF